MQPELDGMTSPPTGEKELLAAAAAHAVFSGLRQATRSDLLTSTVLEVLRIGALETSEVASAVFDEWPGAGITEADVVETLELAADPSERLVLRRDGLHGDVWQLDDGGRDEIAVTQEWMDGLQRRMVDSVKARSESDLRRCTTAEAILWAGRVSSALSVGIRAAEATYLGAVEIGDNALRPRQADLQLMLEMVADGVSEEVGEFLRACVLAALDPSDPFGEEVVSVIATSCLLHGHLARLDVRDEQAVLGPLAGQEAVLDTPLLVGLISGAFAAQPLEAMILAAIQAGVSVIVLKHYLEELDGLLDDSRREEALRLEGVFSDAAQRAAYIALSDADELMVSYAQLRDEGKVSSWEDFEAYARGLRRRLDALGVLTREHGNADGTQVELCRDALARVIADTGSYRGAAAIDRDANTLSMALRHRRRFRRENPSVTWPGLFVITRDRRVGPAFKAVSGEATSVPLALTPSMFTMLLARVRPVPEVTKLVSAAERMLRREVAGRVAVRYPPALAADLAQSLGGRGGATDVRVAQLRSVAQVLESVDGDAGDLLAEVQRRRTYRTRMSLSHANQLGDQERQVTEDRLAVADRQAQTLVGSRDEAREAADRHAQEVESLRQQLTSLMTPADHATLRRRASARAVLAALDLAVAVWLAIGANVWLGVPPLLTGLVLWLQTDEWTRDPTVKLRDALVGIVANTLGVVAPVVGWIATRQ